MAGAVQAARFAHYGRLARPALAARLSAVEAALGESQRAGAASGGAGDCRGSRPRSSRPVTSRPERAESMSQFQRSHMCEAQAFRPYSLTPW